jgi:hypothetical protein
VSKRKRIEALEASVVELEKLVRWLNQESVAREGLLMHEASERVVRPAAKPPIIG